MDLSSGLLATGGIAAVVTTAWSQIKLAFRYVSSLAVVTARLDYSTSRIVGAYLKKHYKPVPSGVIVYCAADFVLNKKAFTSKVPYRSQLVQSIWYGEGRILLSGGKNHSLVLRAPRGTVDFDNLVSRAIDEDESRRHGQKEALNRARFHVRKIMGSEKGPHAVSPRQISGSSDSISGRGPEAVSESSGDQRPIGGDTFEYDPSFDVSFKYPDPSVYQFRSSDRNPLDGLYFQPEVERYIGQAMRWFKMRDWYTERSIPWRRGWLLHGPGGTGKSSLAKVVARKMGIPVFHFVLATLSDQEFTKEWQEMSTPCVALFEDFDTVFRKREPLTQHKTLTFECVLNAISGVETKQGIFLVVTTNHLANIDEAMGVAWSPNGVSTRPGRIDSVIEVGNISRDNRLKMASSVLRDWPELVAQVVDSVDEVTPIQFQEICVQVALDRLSDEELSLASSGGMAGTLARAGGYEAELRREAA